MRLHTEPGDDQTNGSGTWERNDLSLGQVRTDCYAGKEQWWAHSFYLPNDFVMPTSGGGIVMDFHHTGSSGQANFEIQTMPGVGMRLRGYGGPEVSNGQFETVVGPVTKNMWYDFVYHVKWSPNSDGYFHAWMNGKKVMTHNGPTLYTGQGCYLKLANYHSPLNGQASSVIHDRVIRGTTWNAVSLTPLEGVQ